MDKSEKQKHSTIFYRSFYDAIKSLPKENQLDVYNAIFEFSFDFKEAKLEGISKTVFTLIKPQLLANKARYDNALKKNNPDSN